MHELLLFGQIPSSRHIQVLHILAGIAAMQPVSVLEKHMVFKPHRSPSSGRPAQTGAGQGVANPQLQALQAQTQGDLFYLQLVTNISGHELGVMGDGDVVQGENQSERQAKDGANGSSNGAGAILNEALQKARETSLNNNNNTTITTTTATTIVQNKSPEQWTLQFRDLPEVPGRRPVTSRLIADAEIIHGDALKFMSALNYTHTSTYFLTGHRLTHLSTSFLLFRPLVSAAADGSSPTSVTASRLRLLDPSGTYVLQAALRVQDGTKPELMTRGISELLAVKEALKGVVDMKVGDRLSLDTRVR